MNEQPDHHGGAMPAGEQPHALHAHAERPAFNSERAKQIAAEQLDRWATDYPEAARALKALILERIRTRQLVGDTAIMAELKRLEV
jgi:hypothetical protein